MAVSLVGASPAAAAGTDDCEDTESGWGTETAKCNYTCEDNQYVGVHVNVDDNGDIEGTTACGGAGANCDDVSSCDMTSYPVRTVRGGDGSCVGRGDGGWWTRVHVFCWTQNAGASPLDVFTTGSGTLSINDDIIPKLYDDFGAEIELLEADVMVEQATILEVRKESGVYTHRAFTCDADACIEFDGGFEIVPQGDSTMKQWVVWT